MTQFVSELTKDNLFQPLLVSTVPWVFIDRYVLYDVELLYGHVDILFVKWQKTSIVFEVNSNKHKLQDRLKEHYSTIVKRYYISGNNEE